MRLLAIALGQQSARLLVNFTSLASKTGQDGTLKHGGVSSCSAGYVAKTNAGANAYLQNVAGADTAS